MKKIITLLSLLMITVFGALAQQEEPEAPQLDPKAQERINNLRIAYLTEKLSLTTEQAEKFWPIYREFAEHRKTELLKLRDAQKEIDPKNPDPEKQKKVVELGLTVKQNILNLEKDYS